MTSGFPFKIYVPGEERIWTHTSTPQKIKIKCEVCLKLFTNETDFRIHSHLHKGSKRFQCAKSGCYRKFLNKINLELHEKLFHNGKKEKLKEKIKKKLNDIENQNENLKNRNLIDLEEINYKKDEFILTKWETNEVIIRQVQGNEIKLCGIITKGVPGNKSVRE